mgnify:CR=1 FL=1
MLKSFKDSETEKIWHGEFSKKLPTDIQDVARRKLRMLNNSLSINDLRMPRNNRLELLKGDRKGFFSIRISDQWRVCFRWVEGNCFDVEIVDYH